jgi:hypothetical protein
LFPNRATVAGSNPANAPAEVLALAQDRDPAQAGLKAFERQLLEQASIVDDRTPPLVVVIRDVVGRIAGPPTPRPSLTVDAH